MINYRSFSDLNRDILSWIKTLPKDIELIVGIPRSGLFVANMMALYLNVPFCDLQGFIDGRVFCVGRTRYKKIVPADILKMRRKILIVDDSVASGQSLHLVKETITRSQINHKVLYGAVYVNPESVGLVDTFYLILPQPRFFEWNIFHHYLLEKSCVDIDGVLCRDPSEKENDDGKEYLKFLSSAEPFILPEREIGKLVTCRLEKYRLQTENWLKKHGVRYKSLEMMDYPDKEARQKAKAYSIFKSNVYKSTDSKLFIESSYAQAVEISKLSKKLVFCVENMRLILPGGVKSMKYRVKNFFACAQRSPSQAFKFFVRS